MWPFPMESVHPLVVHFPIALLVTAVALDGAAFLLRRPALHRVALWNLALGALAAGAAVWTGLQAAEIAKHSFEIHHVMELHERLGIVTASLAGLITLWRLARRDALRLWERAATTALLLALAGTLACGAHLGGRLVYEFGVGGRFGMMP